MELYNDARYRECWDDQEFVVQTVSKDARCLRLCGDIVRGNKGVIISAVAQNGSSLEYASDELQSDLDVCRTAVQSDGHALAFEDLTVIRAAINHQFVANESEVTDTDEVAFFPPVTGG